MPKVNYSDLEHPSRHALRYVLVWCRRAGCTFERSGRAGVVVSPRGVRVMLTAGCLKGDLERCRRELSIIRPSDPDSMRTLPALRSTGHLRPEKQEARRLANRERGKRYQARQAEARQKP